MYSFKENFPSLISFIDDFFSDNKSVSIEHVTKTLLEKQYFKKIFYLLSDIDRFNVSNTSPAIKTKDLLSHLNCDLFSLTPIEFVLEIKQQLLIQLSFFFEDKNNNSPMINSDDKKYFYLLKWNFKLKQSFIELIRKDGDIFSNLLLFTLTQPRLIGFRWNDGKLLNEILGVKHTKKGLMSLVEKDGVFSLERNKDFSLIFSDGSEKFTFSCDLNFINNRPFYEFPPFLTYEDMEIIEKHLLYNFPLDNMLSDLSNL